MKVCCPFLLCPFGTKRCTVPLRGKTCEGHTVGDTNQSNSQIGHTNLRFVKPCVHVRATLGQHTFTPKVCWVCGHNTRLDFCKLACAPLCPSVALTNRSAHTQIEANTPLVVQIGHTNRLFALVLRSKT